MTARVKLTRDDGRVYLERWGVEHDRLGGVFVHRMTAADPGLDVHDHPWAFVSLILWGGYVEERITSVHATARAQYAEAHGWRRRGSLLTRRSWTWRRFPLDHAHRIITLNARTSWSLVIHGPRRRQWGFYTPDGWIVWTEYEATGRRRLETGK